MQTDPQPKEKNTYALLALIFGGFGAHRFYVMQPMLGLLYFLFCWTLVPSAIGLIEGIVWLIKSREDFQAMIDKINVKREAKLAAKAAALAAKRQSLADKYGERWVDAILSKQIYEGMPLDAAIAAWGKPGKVKEEVGKNGTRLRLYYRPYLNQQKKTSYRMEVRVENGCVEGWKEL